MKRFFTLLAATALTVAAAAAPDGTAERNTAQDTEQGTAKDCPATTVCHADKSNPAAAARHAADNGPAAEDCPAANDCPSAAAASGFESSYRERSEIIMSALRIRKAAVLAVNTREVRRTARKTFNAVWSELADRHEITAGYGLFPYSWSHDYAGMGKNYGSEFEYKGDRYSYSPYRSSGGFAAGYMYRLSRRWSVGLSASMSVVSADAAINGRKLFTDRTTTLGITPAVRLNWIDRPMVKCYSELQISCAFDLMRSTADDAERWNHYYVVVAPTLAGISVGRQLYGFAELGTGLHGVVCAGIGYRFR